jgi:hypothetical protein
MFSKEIFALKTNKSAEKSSSIGCASLRESCLYVAVKSLASPGTRGST